MFQRSASSYTHLYYTFVLFQSPVLLYAQGFDEFGDGLLFEEIPSVYAASKYEQKVTEAPAKVNIVTADEIKLYGYRNLSEILGSMPGTYINDDYNYGYLGVRGVGIPGDYNSRILFLLDGQRINDNLYDSEGILEDALVSMQMIDRVELISGPASSLYGSNAFLGTVNIVTKKGQEFQGTNLRADIGANNSQRVSVAMGERLDNGVDYLFSVEGYTSKGLEKMYFPEFDSALTNNGVVSGLDAEESGHAFGRVSYLNFDLTASFVTREKTVPTASFDTLFNTPGTVTNDDKLFVGAMYFFDLSSTSTLNVRLSYNDYDYWGNYIYDYAELGSAPDVVVYEDYARGKTLSSELFLTKNFERGVLSAGVEYRDNFKQKQKSYDIYETSLDDNRKSRTVGLFAQTDVTVSDRLNLIVGLRYDENSFVEKSQINPRVAAVYKLNQNESTPSILRASYGEAFRAPSANELFYHDSSFTSKPSENLGSESIKTYEIGLDHYFTPRVRASFSAYNYDITDLIALALDPVDDLLWYQNVSAIESTGYEAEIEGPVTEKIVARASYSYGSTKNNLNEFRLVNSPRHVGRISLHGSLWADRLSGSIELQYTGERKTLTNESVASSTPVNLTLVSEDLFFGFTLSATVRNVLDEDIYVPGSPEHLQDSLLQRGRVSQISLSYSF